MQEDPTDRSSDGMRHAENAWTPASDLYKLVTVEDWHWQPDHAGIRLSWPEARRRMYVYGEVWLRRARIIQEMNEKYRDPPGDDYAKLEKRLGEVDSDLDQSEDQMREAFMPWVASGGKPSFVRVHDWFRLLGLGILTSWTDDWYYAIAWEFQTWRSHLWISYKRRKTKQLDSRIDAALHQRKAPFESTLDAGEERKGEPPREIELDDTALDLVVDQATREQDALWEADLTWPDHRQGLELLHLWIRWRGYKLSEKDLRAVRMKI